jgi:hypothetical protein
MVAVGCFKNGKGAIYMAIQNIDNQRFRRSENWQVGPTMNLESQVKRTSQENVARWLTRKEDVAKRMDTSVSVQGE